LSRRLRSTSDVDPTIELKNLAGSRSSMVASPSKCDVRFDQSFQREFLMSTAMNYDEWEMKVKNEGRLEGSAAGQRSILLSLLRARFGAVPSTISARLEAANTTELTQWAVRLLSASTIEDVFATP